MDHKRHHCNPGFVLSLPSPLPIASLGTYNPLTGGMLVRGQNALFKIATKQYRMIDDTCWGWGVGVCRML